MCVKCNLVHQMVKLHTLLCNVCHITFTLLRLVDTLHITLYIFLQKNVSSKVIHKWGGGFQPIYVRKYNLNQHFYKNVKGGPVHFFFIFIKNEEKM